MAKPDLRLVTDQTATELQQSISSGVEQTGEVPTSSTPESVEKRFGYDPANTPTQSNLETQPEFRPRTTDHQWIPTERLYPAGDTLRNSVSQALEMLRTALAYVDESIAANDQDNSFRSDDAITRLKVLLPELFCCREIGDGFGAVVNALYNALKTWNKYPLSNDQLALIRSLLFKLKSFPAIGFDSAIELVEQLQTAGFSVEPPYFEELTEAIAG